MNGKSSILLLTAALVIGCSNAEKSKSTQGRAVTDYFGKEIRIPIQVTRVIPVFNVQSEYLCILGARNKIIGVGVVHPNDYIFDRIFPGIYDLPRVGANTINLEKIVELDPDVVLCGNNKTMAENIERLNIIAVGSFPRDIDGILEQIRITGIIVNKETEADIIIKYLSAMLNIIKTTTDSLPDRIKPGVYYARYHPYETLGRGIHTEIIAAAGGKNVVSDLGESGQALVVSLENIYKWNPDVIILRDKASLSADDLYNDPKWKDINAIRNRRVYREHRNWSEFRVETFFGIMEKAKWFHPDLFADLNPEDEHEKFFELVESFYQ